MNLRWATPEDAATILRFIRELAEYEREPDAVEATESILDAQLRESPPPFECVIAELDGAPVGMALFFHTYSTWRAKRGIWLEDLYVTPSARGRGVGAALLRRLARLTVERGCGRLEWSVLDWNQPAIGFYRKLGATSMDDWTTNRVDGDALVRLAQPD